MPSTLNPQPSTLNPRRDTARLVVVMYHYVRDLPNSPLPHLKGMLVDDFRRQVAHLSQRYEMASLAAALDFLRGSYTPARDLCLLTFDDGLREHLTDVTPILADHRIWGIFFPITSCIEHQRVAAVHKNHFLLAALGPDAYRQAILDLAPTLPAVDPRLVQRTYRWDDPATAQLKYWLNFCLSPDTRDRLLDQLFGEQFGDQSRIASQLYFSWEEARSMQAAGMLMGGHSHGHTALANLSDQQQRDDLSRCAELLRSQLRPQPWWPFCYPYGKPATFNELTRRELQRQHFCCAFATEVGTNEPRQDLFAIRRIDPKDVQP